MSVVRNLLACQIGWICSILFFIANNQVGQVAIGQQNDASQFGHLQNWNSELDFSRDFDLAKAWHVEIGEGRSQVVGHRNAIYVCVGETKKNKNQAKHIHRTIALDTSTGQEIWQHESASNIRDGQENFSGTPISPQATPLIVADRVITLSFTGQLTCLDRKNGKKLWQLDLVDDLGASPVQFGFSSSPVCDSKSPDRFYVMGAGKSGGLFCLNIEDGSTIWKSDIETFSYATPTPASFGGVEQWVVASENQVQGIAKLDGTKLWSFPMPEPGLTNVPTPLVINDQRLLISGQGCKGTRSISVSKDQEDWIVEENWYVSKLQFFYCNWMRWSDDIVIGCTDAYLGAIDVKTGEILARWRGFGDGNVFRMKDGLIVLGGKGNLNVLNSSTNGSSFKGFDLEAKYKILDARCWTPISIQNERIFVRGDDQLVCLKRVTKSSSDQIPNELTNPRTFEFESSKSESGNRDYVQEIFDEMESQGLNAALRMYEKYRSLDLLDEKARLELANAAQQNGLDDVSKMILSHASKDFPASESIRKAKQKQAGK